MSLANLRKDLRKLEDPGKAKILQRFFKTDPGEYGEGDVFIGVNLPNLRSLAKEYKELPISDVQKLLNSKIHEERVIAAVMLADKFKRGDDKEKKQIYSFYLKNTDRINNWDLVDISAHKIVGAFLYDAPRTETKKVLQKLAVSKSLWERRIAIISTAFFISKDRFGETLGISKMLLKDEHDLIHKAVGWMLREVGKRNFEVEDRFLKAYYKQMPRTMLRYAIERFPEPKRQAYLKGMI